MNIDDQIKILEAYKDGRNIIATNSSTERKISLTMMDGAVFNFQNYTYEIVTRELKHTWQPMDTIPANVRVDLLGKNGARHINIETRVIFFPNNYVAWLDAPPRPEWF